MGLLVMLKLQLSGAGEVQLMSQVQDKRRHKWKAEAPHEEPTLIEAQFQQLEFDFYQSSLSVKVIPEICQQQQLEA